jgi:hypothetical protein
MPMKYVPTKNTFVILIFGGGMLLFMLLAIFPNYISFNNIEHEISILKYKIEEQKILSPIFEDLSKKAQFQKPESLPFPSAEKLSTNDTEKITPIIRDIIETNGFTLEKIATDLESLMTESSNLKTSVNILGEFHKLRDVLLDLGNLPYLNHIEVIQVNSFGDKNKIFLTIWVSQER